MNPPNATPSRLLIFLLGFCMFSTGASGLVNEYILATISTYILGNSIEQFSIIIASMMLMMGLSGLLQQFIRDEQLLSRFIQIEAAMAILGGFAPIAIYSAFGYMQNHFLAVHYFFILSIGFLIGFEIPVVMRIIEQYGIRLKHNLKVVYAMDYIGGFIGAIIWVKYLLYRFPLTEISFIVSAFNFLIAMITIGYIYRQQLGRRWKLLLLFLCVSASLFYGYRHNQSWNFYMEQRFYDDPIIDRLTSRYQHLVLTQNSKTGDLRLYINGHTQFSSLDEARYHELLVHPAMLLAPSHQHILILGGGDGLALREVRKYPDIRQLTLVDLDPEMVAWAQNNPQLRKLNQNAFADARIQLVHPDNIPHPQPQTLYLSDRQGHSQWLAQVSVFHIDADRFIHQINPASWDVVIIDFPDPSSVELAKLYTREFYLKLKRILSPHAYVAIQATSPYHAKDVFLSIIKTMESAGFQVLPYHQNIPSLGDWGFILAWTAPTSATTIRKQLAGLPQIPVNTRYLTPELIQAATVFGKNELESNHVCINRLMQPCLLDLYQNYSWIID